MKLPEFLHSHRSVAEGIEHFKDGRHSEAFQCLNKALSIDPRNVEGLVARGALYANNGSFKKAVDDFENALQLNPSHANARKYMGETLVALGRSYEDDNNIEEAKKAYQDCLKIIPLHEEAQNSLAFLRTKSSQSSKPLIELSDLHLPGKFNCIRVAAVRLLRVHIFLLPMRICSIEHQNCRTEPWRQFTTQRFFGLRRKKGKEVEEKKVQRTQKTFVQLVEQ